MESASSSISEEVPNHVLIDTYSNRREKGSPYEGKTAVMTTSWKFLFKLALEDEWADQWGISDLWMLTGTAKYLSKFPQLSKHSYALGKG